MLGSNKHHFYKIKFVLQQLLMVEIAQMVSLGQRYMEYPVLESSRHPGFTFFKFFSFHLSIYPGHLRIKCLGFKQ